MGGEGRSCRAVTQSRSVPPPLCPHPALLEPCLRGREDLLAFAASESQRRLSRLAGRLVVVGTANEGAAVSNGTSGQPVAKTAGRRLAPGGQVFGAPNQGKETPG